MRLKLGRIFTEFHGDQVKDKFSVYVMDFPVIMIRKYQWNHTPGAGHSWVVGLLGFTVGWHVPEREVEEMGNIPSPDDIEWYR